MYICNVCMHACLHACVYVCMHADDVSIRSDDDYKRCDCVFVLDCIRTLKYSQSLALKAMHQWLQFIRC